MAFVPENTCSLRLALVYVFGALLVEYQSMSNSFVLNYDYDKEIFTSEYKHKYKIAKCGLYPAFDGAETMDVDSVWICFAEDGPDARPGPAFECFLAPPLLDCLNANSKSLLGQSNTTEFSAAIAHMLLYCVNQSDIIQETRNALAGGEVPAKIISEAGEDIEIPASFWRTNLADHVLRYDAPAVFGISSRTISGPVFIDPLLLAEALLTRNRRQAENYSRVRDGDVMVRSAPRESSEAAVAVDHKTNRGRPPSHDVAAFLIEAFSILYLDKEPKNQEDLIKKTLVAYKKKLLSEGYTGSWPKETWCKDVIAPLWKRVASDR